MPAEQLRCWADLQGRANLPRCRDPRRGIEELALAQRLFLNVAAPQEYAVAPLPEEQIHALDDPFRCEERLPTDCPGTPEQSRPKSRVGSATMTAKGPGKQRRMDSRGAGSIASGSFRGTALSKSRLSPPTHGDRVEIASRPKSALSPETPKSANTVQLSACGYPRTLKTRRPQARWRPWRPPPRRSPRTDSGRSAPRLSPSARASPRRTQHSLCRPCALGKPATASTPSRRMPLTSHSQGIGGTVTSRLGSGALGDFRASR